MSEKQGWGNICERVDTCALTGAGAFFAAIDKSEVLINGHCGVIFMLYAIWKRRVPICIRAFTAHSLIITLLFMALRNM